MSMACNPSQPLGCDTSEVTSTTAMGGPEPHVSGTGNFLSDPDCRAAFIDDLARSSKIMIVDDEPFNTMIVCKHLKDVGYRSFVSTSDPTQAMDLLRRETPDLLVLDVVMPQVSGLDLLATIRRDTDTTRIPVLILTASTDAETKLTALEAGATDFLAKPVDPSELILRIRNALTVKAHQDYLEDFSKQLEAQVRQRTTELEVARQEAIHCLARAAEYRDQETGFHVVRVGEYVGLIARHLGMDEHRVELVTFAAQLHDVGKIGVSDTILLKP
ncbi:MAG: response regulator [Pirellulales bacterium]